MTDPWRPQLEALGELLRTQRRLAGHSLRDLAGLTDVSSAYLSQLERGLHEPSARVLRSIAGALDLSAETLLAQAGFVEPSEGSQDRSPETAPDTEAAIEADPHLTADQRETLLRVYRSLRGMS
jgi:transcriptional regulator with XRE-family HTH domain